MVNEIWQARIQAIDTMMDQAKAQRTQLKAALDTAITANDFFGVLNCLTHLQTTNDYINGLKDQKTLLLTITTDPAFAADLTKANDLYAAIITQYQNKGLSADLYADVARLRKMLRV
jgi:hypothetical protein